MDHQAHPTGLQRRLAAHKIEDIHPKFKTPVIILVGFYIVGLIPILTGLQISMIARHMAVVLSNILFAFICFGTGDPFPSACRSCGRAPPSAAARASST